MRGTILGQSQKGYDESARVWAKLESTRFWSNKGTRISGFRVSTTSPMLL